tara:strand:+ start:4357 stop:5106 length:750 start_codon:yes stop_codon:yes gene_type:complete
MNILNISPLNGGFSGNEVLLYQYDNGKNFVRKFGGKRLQAQIKKHDESKLPKPLIINREQTFYDMKYISGMDVRTFLENSDKRNLDHFIDLLLESLILLLSTGYGIIDNEEFENKIKSISESIWIENWLLKQDWNDIPKSQSHGDMTFENMIITDDKIVYIDFLDGIDSYMLDYAKLLQDAQCYWFMRDNISQMVATKCDYIASELKKMYGTEKDDQLLVFQLYRILPYCKEQKYKKFIYTAIEEIIIR